MRPTIRRGATRVDLDNSALVVYVYDAAHLEAVGRAVAAATGDRHGAKPTWESLFLDLARAGMLLA